MILNFIFLQSTKLQKRSRQHNKREEKTGLSFIAEGRMFFGIGEDDLANFDIQKLPNSQKWAVMYHGIRFEVDEETAQNLKKHLSSLKK